MEPSVRRHCGIAYISKSGLRQHELSHAKVGPHMCCGKIFYSQANLTRHKCNVHEEEKAFACNQCDKKFAIRADLERHRKREKKEFKFTCDMCGEKLVAKDKLKEHMDRHNNNKSHVCPVCHKMFRYSSNLSRHKKSHQERK